MEDPFNAIMRVAGFDFLKPTEEYRGRNHVELVFNALRNIGVAEERLPEFANRVASAGFAAGPRDIATESRIAAEGIEGAIADFETGLRLLNKGLHTIGFARSTATPNSTDRIENLAQIHAALIGVVADAVAKGIAAGESLDEHIADSVPDYWPGGYKDQWTHVFSMAAERAKRIGEAFPRTSYHAKKRDRSAWLGRLIPELGKVFEEATGKPPVVSNPSEKARTDWRCPFACFVEDVWGYLDPTDGPCPGDDRIMGALTNPAEPLKTT